MQILCLDLMTNHYGHPPRQELLDIASDLLDASKPTLPTSTLNYTHWNRLKKLYNISLSWPYLPAGIPL